MDHETPQRKDVDAKAGKDVKNKASSLPEFSPITDSMQINEARELGDFDDQGLHERRANGESTDDASSPSVNGDEVMSEDEAVIAFVLLTNGMKGPEELSSVYVPKVKEMNNVEVISLPQYDPTKNSMQNKRRKVCINSNSKFPPPSLGEEPSHLIINLKTCPQLLDKVSSSSSISKLSFATPVKLKAPLKLFGKHIFSTEEMSRDKKPMHVCRICSKNFLSSQALGGHMSHHTRKSNAVGGKLIPATIEREVIDAHSTVVTDVNEPIRVTEINNHCMKEIDVRHGTRNTNIPDGFLHQSSARVGEATDSPQSFDETCKEILPALNNSRLQLDIDLNMPPKMDDDDADENTDPF
ncbi:hypothetical protein KP509_06G039900 [Ceratopteris richardii]|uniref:C2H2-type domain-containing protein n=1 Tax=Ceratopteris richardii TaxID=49495 RepID=A0A8T2UF78_CERRI|nr:hypothetical protein KP509_06G039900 [Ceratopteris richardii]